MRDLGRELQGRRMVQEVHSSRLWERENAMCPGKSSVKGVMRIVVEVVIDTSSDKHYEDSSQESPHDFVWSGQLWGVKVQRFSKGKTVSCVTSFPKRLQVDRKNMFMRVTSSQDGAEEDQGSILNPSDFPGFGE